MNSRDDLDRQLRRWMTNQPPATDDALLLDQIARRTSSITQHQGIRARLIGRDRSSTTARRFPTMSASVRLMILAVLVTLGTGSIYLGVGQSPSPLPISSASPSPAADPSPDPAMAPAWVTGTITLASTCTDATITQGAGVEHQQGYLCEPQTWTTSDPRTTGTATSTWNADVYRVDGATISVAAGTYDLRNGGGGWLCHYQATLGLGSGLITTADGDETITCSGYGGYEGLTAVLVNDWTKDPVTITGLIFPGETPPIP